MYLNSDMGDTNIDNQFKKSHKKKIKNFKKSLIIASIILALIVLIILIMIFFRNRTRYFITLLGDESIQVYQNGVYVEPGYSGFDNNNNNLTNSVKVINNIDISKIGKYEVIYKLNGTTKKRTVSVIEKGVGVTYIHLNGDENIYLSIGEDYIDPGYQAIDSVDSDITNNVKVTTNINSSVPGVYRVTYTVVNSSGVTAVKTRTVIVR